MTATKPEKTEDQRFIGYGPAADYVGLARNTLSSYVARGIGPEAEPDPEPVGQYNLPVFLKSKLDTWMANRPGQGARTDLIQSV